MPFHHLLRWRGKSELLMLHQRCFPVQNSQRNILGYCQMAYTLQIQALHQQYQLSIYSLQSLRFRLFDRLFRRCPFLPPASSLPCELQTAPCLRSPQSSPAPYLSHKSGHRVRCDTAGNRQPPIPRLLRCGNPPFRQKFCPLRTPPASLSPRNIFRFPPAHKDSAPESSRSAHIPRPSDKDIPEKY